MGFQGFLRVSPRVGVNGGDLGGREGLQKAAAGGGVPGVGPRGAALAAPEGGVPRTSGGVPRARAVVLLLRLQQRPPPRRRRRRLGRVVRDPVWVRLAQAVVQLLPLVGDVEGVPDDDVEGVPTVALQVGEAVARLQDDGDDPAGDGRLQTQLLAQLVGGEGLRGM
eukprot:1195360-Prorocentrum_minimum.AAC.2